MAYNQIPLEPEAGFTKHSELVVGRVVNVVLSPYLDDKKTRNVEYTSPSDLGKILYSVVYRNKQISLGENSSRPAWPIFSFIKQYPVLGELVLIVLGPTINLNDNASAMQAYYFPPFNVWNSSNNNVFPNMSEYADFLKKYYEKKGYNYDANSKTSSKIPEFPKGVYFKEKEVKNITPFEGDSIIEGRYGQSIRFGSTATQKKNENTWSNSGKDGDPIIIIRNGQGRDSIKVDVNPENAQILSLPDQPTVENINEDHCSIYLTAGQEIVLEDIAKGLFPMESYSDVRVKTNMMIASTNITTLSQNPISNESKSARDNDKTTLNNLA